MLCYGKHCEKRGRWVGQPLFVPPRHIVDPPADSTHTAAARAISNTLGHLLLVPRPVLMPELGWSTLYQYTARQLSSRATATRCAATTHEHALINPTPSSVDGVLCGQVRCGRSSPFPPHTDDDDDEWVRGGAQHWRGPAGSSRHQLTTEADTSSHAETERLYRHARQICYICIGNH